MAVSFNQIPAGLKVPLFYAEMDNSMANLPSVDNRALIIGQRLSTGSVPANTLGIMPNIDQADGMHGAGSQLAEMLKQYRKNDPFTEVWYLSLDDAASSTAATATLTIAGTASVSGAIAIYLAGDRIVVGVNKNDTAAVIAANVAAAVNADTTALASASVASGVVTFTAKNKGTLGNDLTLLINYRGISANEYTPTGLTLTATAFSGGAVDPNVGLAMALLGDEPFEYIGMPYSDAASLDSIGVEMNDIAGRWSYARQLYGHVYSAKRGTLSANTTFGKTRNDQHVTIFGVAATKPHPVFLEMASELARTAVFINADPARPTQTGALIGILPAPAGKDFNWSERQSLLNAGIATTYTVGGVVRIERAITTYQKNAWGQADVSYLDSETMHQSAYVLRRLRSAITSKYGRHKLANDGTRFGEGQAMVTPSVIKGELLSEYRKLEDEGIVENFEAFKAALIVERDANNPNRVNILFPPDLVNQLRIFALLYQFRLQYPQTA